MKKANCRFCNHELKYTLVDMGMSPLSNAYLHSEDLKRGEVFYPLHVYVCEHCYLAQLEEFETPDKIFSDYAYFSSFSESWLSHAKEYTGTVTNRFILAENSQVIELASNDGYLLQYFKEKGIPVLGIEPAANVAKVAEGKGIPTLTEFFGVECAEKLVGKGITADLLIGNNVLAHVPNLNDFVKGMKIILKPSGVITLEFPHLMKLIQYNQFDTIYHEHFSYFSLTTLEKVFLAHELTIFDVDEIPTHGGSLRIYVRHTENDNLQISERITKLLDKENTFGIRDIDFYGRFSEQVKETKRKILEFLINIKREGKRIAGYGAPAKGNTLLNYCGIRTDFVDFTVDRNPHKQGMYLPGVHIPIFSTEKINEAKPDYIFILPWNLKEEIVGQLEFIRDWGGKFIIPIPEVVVI